MIITPKEFQEFLLYIGIITEETETNFNDILELIQSSFSNTTHSSSRLSIDELLSSSFECYLQQMTSEKRREMSVNIVKRFKENKLNSSHSRLIKLVFIYSKLQIIPLYRKLLKWKNVKERTVVYQTSIQNQEEVFDDFQRVPIERTRNHPSLLTRSKQNLSHSMINFMERQEKFKKTHSQSIAKVISNNEIEYTMLCTFSPQINRQVKPCLNNYISKVKQANPCLRLYEESKLRLTKKEQLDKKKKDAIEVKPRKNSTKTPNKNNSTQYVKQYEDYKKQKANKKRLKERLDNESDCTFKPVSYHNLNSNYNPSNRPTSRPSSNISRSASQSLIDSIVAKTKSHDISPIISNNASHNA